MSFYFDDRIKSVLLDDDAVNDDERDVDRKPGAASTGCWVCGHFGPYFTMMVPVMNGWIEQ